MSSTVTVAETSGTQTGASGNWNVGHSIALVAIVAAGALSEWAGPQLFGARDGSLAAWLATMVLLAALAVVIGHGITGLWWGILIDPRNKMSLSRLQIILWTVVVLSALLTILVVDQQRGEVGLSVTIPGTILWVLGISSTSAVGAPLILSTKASRSANLPNMQQTMMVLKQQGVDVSAVAAKGQLVVRRALSDADWSDLFKGEEVENAAQLDLGKVQLFYFTLILVGAYAFALATTLEGSTSVITALPSFDQSLVVLLGISHGAYLTNKAVPHSQSPGAPETVLASDILAGAPSSDSTTASTPPASSGGANQ